MYNQGVPFTRKGRRLSAGGRRQNTVQRYDIPLVEAARRLCMDQSNLFIALQTGQIPTLKKNGGTLVGDGAFKEYQSRKHLGSTFRY
ncbi:hypothetical protein FD725_11690 [Nostoc sp. TCL26-01]|nr:hypothetical protein FD725_11690 [Nostoc sp. TCL26-01]